MTGHVYIYRQGDREIILNYIQNFKTLSNEELLAKAVDFSKKGFFGVHQQGLYFIALWKECKNRCLESPLQVENNLLTIKEESPHINEATSAVEQNHTNNNGETEMLIPEKGRKFLEELKSKGPNLDKVGKSFIYIKYKFKG